MFLLLHAQRHIFDDIFIERMVYRNCNNRLNFRGLSYPGPTWTLPLDPTTGPNFSSCQLRGIAELFKMVTKFLRVMDAL